MSSLRAPNRVLDLEELERPSFRRVLERMDELCGRDPVSYLHPGKRWEYPWALERAELRDGAAVLDVGCGDSIFPVYLAQQGHRVHAADIEFDGRLGALHGVPIEYLRADMRALPLADASMDAVFCISVIEHLPPDTARAAMREMRRILRPGARLLLTTDLYRDADAEIWHESPGHRFRVDWSIFDEPRLRALLRDAAGFELEGDLDLDVDWQQVEPAMRRFHGYPYTSVGVCLRAV